MKVIFLNTWHGAMQTELRTYVAQHLRDTAVFCFQEASDPDRTPYEDLLADDYVLHRADRCMGDTGNWYGNVIYVRKDVPIIETGSIFSEAPMEFEIGLAAYVTIKLDDQKVTICNVHGVPYPGHKLDTEARVRQSQTILDTFEDRESVVIGGDFNLLPETKSVRLFSEYGYQDLIADYDIKTTRNRITYERHPDNIQLYADFAFVSASLQVDDFSVPSEIVSDHQPLELSFSVGDAQLVTHSAGRQEQASQVLR